MNDERQCPQHGPYPAYLGSCPYCGSGGGGLPPAPTPLAEEETYPRGVPMRAVGPTKKLAYSDDDDTVLPGQGGYGGGSDSDSTQPPLRRGGADFDMDETQPPERKKKWLDGEMSVDDDLDETVLDREDTSLLGWLVVKKSPAMRRGHTQRIRKGMIIGRSPKKADFVVDDEKISGMHVRFQVKEDQFILIDLGSANGTFLNDEEVLAATIIKENDEIRIGDTVFVLKTL